MPHDHRHDEVGPEDQHQDRQAAHGVDDSGRRVLNGLDGRRPGHPHHDGEGKRKQQPGHGEKQRERQAANGTVRKLADQEQKAIVTKDVDHRTPRSGSRRTLQAWPMPISAKEQTQ
ncbi:hypothetical protein D3C71_1735290 [compost metagenome]